MISYLRYNAISILLCIIIQINSINTWGLNIQPLSPLRNILSLHAIASTVLRQLKEESFQKQLDTFTYSSDTLYDKLVENIAPPVIHFTKREILNISNAFCLCIFILSWIGYDYYYNSTKSSIYKLNNLVEFKELQMSIRIVVFVLSFIFLRNIENAI